MGALGAPCHLERANIEGSMGIRARCIRLGLCLLGVMAHIATSGVLVKLAIGDWIAHAVQPSLRRACAGVSLIAGWFIIYVVVNAVTRLATQNRVAAMTWLYRTLNEDRVFLDEHFRRKKDG